MFTHFILKFILINMLHRLFNAKGMWYKPAHLNPAQWGRTEFAIDWKNLNNMFDLRKFYVEIAPPFDKDAAPRVAEMELLHDDIVYYHTKRSWYHFIVWVLFTVFAIDLDDMERPGKHYRQDAQPMNEYGRIRQSFCRDDK